MLNTIFRTKLTTNEKSVIKRLAIVGFVVGCVLTTGLILGVKLIRKKLQTSNA